MIGAVSAHAELAQDICKCLGTELCRTAVVRFSNENLLVQNDENVREADVFVIQPSCPPVSDGIIELLMTIDALKHASAGRITAVLPYFPYARSDKKDRPRVSITARLMADLLQTAGAGRILTMNLHSPQVQGFFRNPADQLQAAPLLCTTSGRAATSRTTCSSPATSANRRTSATTRPAWICRSPSWASGAPATTRWPAR
jgi:ribose-phosphate pyrophosphokinase